METPFSHYKSTGNYLDAQGQLTPYSVVRSGRNSNSSEILCMSDQKQPRKGGDTLFPFISQWGLSVAVDTRVLIQSALKNYTAFSHPPVMLHIKFDQDWPTGLRDIQVRKCKILVIQGQVTPK